MEVAAGQARDFPERVGVGGDRDSDRCVMVGDVDDAVGGALSAMDGREPGGRGIAESCSEAV